MFVRMSFCFLFVSFLLPLEATSQELTKFDLFQREGDELYWRNMYEYSMAADDLRPRVVQMLKSKFFTFNVIRNATGYNGEIRHYTVDCKRYDRTYLTTPRMYWDGEWTGKFTVEVLPNQYRVTVYALYFEKMEQSVGYYRNEKPIKGRYIDAVTRKNKSGFRKNEFSNLALMSLSLRDNFDIKNTQTVPDEH